MYSFCPGFRKKLEIFLTFFITFALLLWPFTTNVFATEVFSDGFESNDFTAWDGGSASVATRTIGTDYALTGTYGTQFAVNKTDADSNFVASIGENYTTPSSNLVYLKFQIAHVTNTSVGYELVGSKAVGAIYSAGNRMAWLIIGRGSNGRLSLRGVYRSKDGTDTFFGSEVELPDSNTHTVKLMLDKSGANPTVQWWLDGTSQASATDSSSGVDGVGRSPSRAWFGIVHVVNFEKGNYSFNEDAIGIYDADPDNTNPSAPSSLGGASLVDGSFGADNTPTLTATLSDPNASDTVQYQIQIDDSSDFSSPVVDYTSALAAQGSVSFTVGQAASSGTYTTGSEGQTLTDGSYYWQIKAIDNSAAASAYTQANSGSIAFKVDTTAPSTPGTPSTTTPTADTTPTWSWTASTDSGSGLASTPYTVEWCTDSGFSGCGSNTSTSSTNSFTHATALAAGTWYFRVKTADAVSNSSSYSSNGSVVINTTAPTGSISISSGSSNTKTRAVTLTISATDDSDGAADLTMEVSENSDFSGASYETYATSKSWTLSTTDGTKTVYIRFKDSAGNVSDTYSDSITLDATEPAGFNLDSPGDQGYTNSNRPTFRWKTTTDATSGLSKYIFEIDNGTEGDFTIDDIPTSRTTDLETSKYNVHYENFSDSDSTNNYISIYTKSSSNWGSGENDGKLKEGKRTWKVKAVDGAGNERSESRILFVDQTTPSVEFTQINDVPFSSEKFSSTDKTPTIFGKITDPLATGDSSTATQGEDGPKIASGPSSVEIKLEKKEGLSYKVQTLYTINMDSVYYVCDQDKTIDNSKNKCDKYLPFVFTPKEDLNLGAYKITISGKDRSGNQSSSKSFTLNIGTLAQIATPQEKKIIEEKIEQLPKEKQEEAKKEVEITKPTTAPQPGLFQKTGEQITHVSENLSVAVFQATRQLLAATLSTIITTGNLLSDKTSAVDDVTTILVGFSNQTFNNTKEGFANLTFTLGEKTQDLSENTGLAIVKFGYLFVNEPTRIYNVQVAVLSPTSVKISWQTNHPATGKVNWGLDETYPFDIQSDKRVTDHEFTLTNLKPGTEYSFEVMSQNKNYVYDANRKFKTSPKTPP